MWKIILFVTLAVAVVGLLTWALWDNREVEYGPNVTSEGVVVRHSHTPASYRPKIGDMPARHTPAKWRVRISVPEINTTFYSSSSADYNRTHLNKKVSVTYRKKWYVTYEKVANTRTGQLERKELDRESGGWVLVMFE
jgi:hypothetical protein